MKHFLAVFLLLSLGGCSVLLSGMCGNNIIQEIPSPDGRFKAVIFERNCGATTGFSTQVSILPSQHILGGESGNVFVVDDGNHKTVLRGRGNGPSVWAKWLNSNHLEVIYARHARTFAMKKQLRNITIAYQEK